MPLDLKAAFDDLTPRDNAAGSIEAAFADLLPKGKAPLAPVDRTWGEAISDQATIYKNKLAEGIASLPDAPRKAVNLLSSQFLKPAGGRSSHYGVTPQLNPPDRFADFRESIRIEKPEALTAWEGETAGRIAADRAANLSGGAKYNEEVVQNAKGVGGVLSALWNNPGAAGDQATGMIGHLGPVLAAGPIGRAAGLSREGAVLASLGTAGAEFGNMTAQQVEQGLMQAPPEVTAPLIAELRRRMPMAADWTDEQALKVLADQRATDAFGMSAIVNSVFARIMPGGATVERFAAGLPGKVGVGRLGNTLGGLVGEGSTEFVQGGADQVVQNVGTTRPTWEGVPEAATLEGVLGAKAGALSGAAATPQMPAKQEAELKQRAASAAASKIVSAVQSGATPEQAAKFTEQAAADMGLPVEQVAAAVQSAMPVAPPEAAVPPVAPPVVPEAAAPLVEPVVEAAPAPAPARVPVEPETPGIDEAWERYNTVGTINDLADDLDSQENLPPELQSALDDYRKEQEDDYALAGRGDMDSAEDALSDAVSRWLSNSPVQEAPAVEATPEAAVEAALTQEPVEAVVPVEQDTAAPVNSPEDTVTASYLASQFPESKRIRALVDKHEETGDLGGLLRDLAAQPGVSKPEAWLAGKLAGIMDALGVKLVPATVGSAGIYNINNNTVEIRQANAETALHEVIHGATSALMTSKAVANIPAVRKAKQEIDSLISHVQGRLAMGEVSLDSLHPQVKRMLADKQGPTSNIKEFLAYGLTNKNFQDFLASIPAPPERANARNSWDAFKDMVKDLLGAKTPEQRSTLDALIESSGDLVDFAEANPAGTKVARFGQASQLASDRGDPPPKIPEQKKAAPAPTPEQKTTSTKKAVVDEERKARGLESVEPDEAKSAEEHLTAARATLASDTGAADRILRRYENDYDGKISVSEEAILLAHRNDLYLQLDKLSDEASDSSMSEGDRAHAKIAVEENEAQINRIDQAVRQSSSEWGRFGNFKQRELARDWSFKNLARKERVSRARALTPSELAEVREQADKIEAAVKAAEKSSKELTDTFIKNGVEYTYEQLAKEILGNAKKNAGGQRIAALKVKADAARKRIAANATQLNSGVDPAMFVDLVHIGAYHVAKGADDLATFTRKMKAELGKAWDAWKGRIDEIHSESVKKAGEKPVQTLEQAVDSIDVNEGISENDVAKVVLAHIRAGVTNADDAMKATHKSLRKIAPDMTERDVRDLFSGYGKVRFPNKDADLKKRREIRAVVQLEAAIADLENNLPAKKSGVQRDKPTLEIRRKREILNELLKSFMRSNQTPETMASYLDARKRNVLNQIEDVEGQLKSGERKKKPERIAPEDDVELSALRDTLRRKRDELKSLDAPPKKTADEIYQQSRNTSMKNQLVTLNDRIASKDYAKVPRVDKKLSAENRKLHKALNDARREFLERQFLAAMKNRSVLAKAWATTMETLGLSRAIMTGLDLSATFRQGGFYTIGHPVKAARIFAKSVAAAISASRADEYQRKMENHPRADLHRKAGLVLTDTESVKLSDMEEQFMSRWLQRDVYIDGQKIKNVGRFAKNWALAPFRGSSRAFTSFLNITRVEMFEGMIEGLPLKAGQPTIEEAKKIANFVNAATGRSSNEVASYLGPSMNTVFFAPKLVAGRFQLVLGYGLYGSTHRVRVAVAKEYARFAIGMASIYTAAYMLNAGFGDDDDDKPLVELSPRNSSFGQVRVGRSYINPTASLSPIVILLARMITGERKTDSGEIIPLVHDGATMSALINPDEADYDGPKYGQQTLGSTIATFLKYKLSPVMSTLIAARTKRDALGRPTTTSDALLKLVIPITASEMKEQIQGTGYSQGLVMSAFEIMGMGTQYRDPAFFEAPDYANLTGKQKEVYGDFLHSVKNPEKSKDELQKFANTFTKDDYWVDVRDAVETRASELGLEGVSVDTYARNTQSKNEDGTKKRGLKFNESGSVKLKYDDDAPIKDSRKASALVGKINKQIVKLSTRPMTYKAMNDTLEGFGMEPIEGEGNMSSSDKGKVIDLLAKHRESVMREYLNEN